MFWRPAVSRIIDASEPRFVLEENFERLAYGIRFGVRFFEDAWPVFLKAA